MFSLWRINLRRINSNIINNINTNINNYIDNMNNNINNMNNKY